jgi:hypothetical protein
MQRCAHELLDETPVGVVSVVAPVLSSDLFVVVVDALGLRSLSLIGLLLISPGCG